MTSERTLSTVAGGLFALTAGATIYWAGAMAGGMPMPGGWTMSMMWMRMPGQTSVGAAAMFAVMWVAMMVAMMLPASLPILLLYRRAAAFRGDSHVDRQTALLSAAYFFVWLCFGLAAYALGLTIASAAMADGRVSRLVPVASGIALVVAGAYQLTPWKAACLRHCRDPLELVAHHLQRGSRGAMTLGLHHGAYCVGCCWSLMLMQLVLGVMNLPVMIVVALVIAGEKLTARGQWLARATGGAAIALGLVFVGRAVLGWRS